MNQLADNPLKQLLLGVAQKVAHQKLATLLVGSMTLLSSLAIHLRDYLAQYMPPQSQGLAVTLVAISLWLTFICISIFLWFKPKLVVSQKDGGCWLDNKTGIRYCVSCKIKYNQLIPLKKGKNAWSCNVIGCEQVYFFDK